MKSKCDVADASTADDDQWTHPDMQVPQWTVKDNRPLRQMHPMVRLLIIVALAAYTHLVQSRLRLLICLEKLDLIALAFASTASVFASDRGIELSSCIVKLVNFYLCICRSPQEFPLEFYGLLWLIECCRSNYYDYSCLFKRTLLAMTIVLSTEEQYAVNAMLRVSFVCIDVASLTGALGWMACHHQQRDDYISPHAWTALWIIFLLSITVLISSIITILVDPSCIFSYQIIIITSAVAMICFEKMRDLSEAFQVFNIKCFYSESNISKRLSS
jgi:hypothetical protein